MNTLSSTPESSNAVSVIVDKLNQLRNDLFNVFENLSFDKVSDYGMRIVQGVFAWVKWLFADVIVMKLNQVATLIKELKSIWYSQGFQPAYINSLIELQRSQMMIKMNRHNFFKENFGRRVNEIFA